MERINVSKEFRVCKSNCNFKMKFGKKVDMLKVYKTMEAVVNEISNGAEYSKLWLQDLADGSGKDSFIIEYSTLFSHEFNEYVPAMCKAVAQALPDVDFDAYALYDDHKCCWVDEFEVSFKAHHLTIIETFEDDDHGYFCPECGYQIAACGKVEDRFESDKIECDDCGETIKVSDLKYVPPTVTKSEYYIK